MTTSPRLDSRSRAARATTWVRVPGTGGHIGYAGHLAVVRLQREVRPTGVWFTVVTLLPMPVPAELTGDADLSRAKRNAENYLSLFLRAMNARWRDLKGSEE